MFSSPHVTWKIFQKPFPISFFFFPLPQTLSTIGGGEKFHLQGREPQRNGKIINLESIQEPLDSLLDWLINQPLCLYSPSTITTSPVKLLAYGGSSDALFCKTIPLLFQSCSSLLCRIWGGRRISSRSGEGIPVRWILRSVKLSRDR